MTYAFQWSTSHRRSCATVGPRYGARVFQCNDSTDTRAPTEAAIFKHQSIDNPGNSEVFYTAARDRFRVRLWLFHSGVIPRDRISTQNPGFADVADLRASGM